MADLDKDVIVVAHEDSTVVTVEQEVHVVTVETPVQIHSDADQISVIEVVAEEESSIATEEEVVHIVSEEEETNVITDVSEGPQGPPGFDGKSAYDLAVLAGFVGTVDEWLLSLKGEKGDQGDKGADGAGGTGGAAQVVWILDVVPTSTGIVGQKQYRPYISSTPIILTGVADTTNVRVRVGAEGGAESYSPTVTVNGVAAILTESSTVRWFTGYADLVLVEGPNVITASVDGVDQDSITINVSTGGPDVLSVTFGSFPGIQTALKHSDLIQVTITTELDATDVVVKAGGACKTQQTWTVTNGVASGIMPISALQGAHPITVFAKNSLGTPGADFVSATLPLDQTVPQFVFNSMVYSSGRIAARQNETVTIDVTVTDFTSIQYSSTVASVPSATAYAKIKTATITLNGYSYGQNYTIIATKSSNGTTASYFDIIKVASVAPTASISINGNPARLVSSPVGIDYEVRVTPNQVLKQAPSMNASIGTWQGAWSYTGGYWKRNLRISDSDARGTGTFTSLVMVNEADIQGSTITSGSTYIVGGFSTRTVTWPAFSRVAPLGVAVANGAKVSCQIIGGKILTGYADNAVRQNGFYIANADGSYNATGSYIGLSDSAFAGANTSGTLQASVQEVA